MPNSTKSTEKRSTTGRTTRDWRKSALARGIMARLLHRNIRPVSLILAGTAFSAFSALMLLFAGWNVAPGFCYFLALSGMQARLVCGIVQEWVEEGCGQPTAIGTVWGELPDRIADALLIVAAGYGASGSSSLPAYAWTAAVLTFATSTVRTLGASFSGTHFFCGPMAKQQRIAALSICCALAMFLPNVRGNLFELTCLIICAGCLLTIFRRVKLILAGHEMRRKPGR